MRDSQWNQTFLKSFNDHKMEILLHERQDRKVIHHRLFSEIELGIIKDATGKELLSIVKKMINQHCIDGLILGCTELPLILDKDDFGIPFLNTTAIYMESIVKYYTEKDN